MGIDCIGAVSLKPGTTPKGLNERFKTIHEQYDTCLRPCDELIGGNCADRYDDVEETNAYRINFDLARYYGKGYARGPWMKIMTQLEWLRAQPEVVAVYYGGDCSDSPSLWTREDTLETLQYFFERGHSTYRSNQGHNGWETKRFVVRAHK